MADASRVPVINALSDRFHPCQALADMFTLLEQFGTLRDRRVAYIGDGNNVCNSLMHAATILGVGMVVVTPEGFEPSPRA
jgi:ornithine carbamoyltransferase